MRKVWTSCGITLKNKLKLFNAIVLSILMYGGDTRKGLKETGNILRVFKSKFPRKIMSIKWYEHITEKIEKKRSDQPSMMQKIKLQKRMVLRACVGNGTGEDH